jgi:CRISPR-associated protein Cmr5
MQTRDQKYAVDVYKQVTEVKKNFNEVESNRYGAMAHQLPILICSAGLAQALAFLDSRDNQAHKQLLTDLAATVGQPGRLLKSAREAGIDEYMYLTRQVMDALLWYKRFAQSVLDVKASDAGRDVSQPPLAAQTPPLVDVQATNAGDEKR